MYRTEINIKPAPIKIDLQSNILTIGSCFADSMGLKFHENKFNVSANPFGNIYNPHSIFELLTFSSFNQIPVEYDRLVLEKEYSCLHHLFHSEVCAKTPGALKEKISTLINNTHTFLSQCNFLIITFGSAWVYRHNATGLLVSNCHKIPASEFQKELLSTKEIINGFNELKKSIHQINSGINIILTVSPVRHLKDTLALNNVSKSNLISACHYITEQHLELSYFPSYEIMMDDLRDYRFYKEDMIHPSPLAENYIWEQFSQTYFNQNTQSFLEKWAEIRKAIQHKPFHPQSKSHQKFIQETILKLKQLSSQVPVEKELHLLQSQLIND